MDRIVNIAEAETGVIIILVEWSGFGQEERTWEPLEQIYCSAPDFVRSELKKRRLTRAVRSRLESEYNIRV